MLSVSKAVTRTLFGPHNWAALFPSIIFLRDEVFRLTTDIHTLCMYTLHNIYSDKWNQCSPRIKVRASLCWSGRLQGVWSKHSKNVKNLIRYHYAMMKIYFRVVSRDFNVVQHLVISDKFKELPKKRRFKRIIFAVLKLINNPLTKRPSRTNWPLVYSLKFPTFLRLSLIRARILTQLTPSPTIRKRRRSPSSAYMQVLYRIYTWGARGCEQQRVVAAAPASLRGGR